MARASSVNSTWVGELASGVSIGGSTLTIATASGTDWPSGSGVFGVQVGEDQDDDAELCQVTRSSTTLTLSGSTLAKAHSAGVNIYYLATAEDINAKPDDSVVLHTTGTESASGVKTFSSGIITDGITASDDTASISIGFDTVFLFGGASYVQLDGNNNFLSVVAMYAATGGFSLGTLDQSLTADYLFPDTCAECQRVLVTPDANGHTIEMSAPLPAYGEVIFENASGTYSFSVDDDPISGTTVVGGPVTVAAGAEKKFYYHITSNEWRETAL